MSNTNANILILSPDKKLYQLYKYGESDPSILGELLRQKILQSLGILLVNPKKQIFSNFIDSIREFIFSEQNKNGVWKNEGVKNLNDFTSLNKNIDYTYIVNFYKDYSDILYYSLCTIQIYEKKTYIDLITYISSKQFSVPLSSKIKDTDDFGVSPF